MSQTLTGKQKQPKPQSFATIPTDDEIAAELKASGSVTSGDEADTANDGAGAADELPDKFKGKSALEIAESYANLEQELGRKSQEVGSLRTLTDQLLEVKPTVNEHQEAVSQGDLPELTADDVLNDPRSAIQTVAREEGVATNKRVDALEAQLGMNDFVGRHPDFRKDMQNPEFLTFVQGSDYRQSLAQKTLDGDLSAADELWGAWSEKKPGEGSTKELTAAEKDAQDTAASIAIRGGGESTQAGQQPISRQELARIKIEEEDRYYSPKFQAYIQKMYAAKLVK